MQTPLHTFCQLLIWKCAWISGDFNWANQPEGRVSKLAIHFEKSQMGSLDRFPFRRVDQKWIEMELVSLIEFPTSSTWLVSLRMYIYVPCIYIYTHTHTHIHTYTCVIIYI